MADLQKTIDRCKKSISDGEPIYDYKFYYDVIELLAEKKPIEPFKEAQTVGGWISVKDKLPEEKENQYTKDYQEVLCVLKTRFGTDVRVYKFGKGHFWNESQEIDRMISHWMPFPEPPKEE